MRRIVSLITLICFLMTGIARPSVHAQGMVLPAPGTMVSLSAPYHPPVLAGIKVYANDPLRMDFILDKGDLSTSDQGAVISGQKGGGQGRHRDVRVPPAP